MCGPGTDAFVTQLAGPGRDHASYQGFGTQCVKIWCAGSEVLGTVVQQRRAPHQAKPPARHPPTRTACLVEKLGGNARRVETPGTRKTSHACANYRDTIDFHVELTPQLAGGMTKRLGLLQ